MKKSLIKLFSISTLAIALFASCSEKNDSDLSKQEESESFDSKDSIVRVESSIDLRTYKSDYVKYVSQEVDFEGEDFVEDCSELSPLTDFFESINIPMGCKVCIVDENEIYDAPKNISSQIKFFKNNEIVTVGMITTQDQESRYKSEEKDYNEFWVKIISNQYQTGWTKAGNLKMVSENPNAPSITPQWSFFGAYGSDFSPDGKYVCLKNWGAHNGTTGTLRVFEVESGTLITKYDAAEGYNQDSSESVVFSKDSKCVYFEEDLVLKSIDIESGEITSYGSPVYDNGDLSRLLIDQKGERILFLFNWSNENLNAALFDIQTESWSRISSYSEATKLKWEFEGFDPRKLNLGMRYFMFEYGDYYRILPEKNLLLCAATLRNQDDRDFKGIYFFELSTGKFIKAENPFARMGGPVYVDGFDINAEGTKIAVRTEGEDTRVTNMTYYICDIDLPEMKPTVPKGSDFNEKLAREEDDIFYLTSNNFTVTDYDGNYKARIDFFEDNTFFILNGPNGEPGYGTYKVLYNPEQDYTKVFFDNITCWDKSMEATYSDELMVGSFGWLDRETFDFYTEGGITYSDDYERFVRCDKESEPYKEYYFHDQDVIKYPQRDGAIRIRVNENLRMRDGPSVDANIVECPFSGSLNGEYTHIDSRNVVFEGQKFYIIASSTEKDTIDGRTDYWYLIRVLEDEYDDFGESEAHLVWIFGGYTTKLSD